jgi:prepilin-type processing-associated H-X9-DG protein
MVQLNAFGGDAGGNPNDEDCLLQYQAEKGMRTTSVRIGNKESALQFMVMDFKGHTIWDTGGGNTSGSVTMPLLWMSYGANALAGLKTAKGSPAMITESAKCGIFPLPLGQYPADYLGTPNAANGPFTPLRFHHGGRSSDPRLKGGDFWTYDGNYVTSSKQDMDYTPRERTNTGFLDGHAERVQASRMLRNTSVFWLGTGRGSERQYE